MYMYWLTCRHQSLRAKGLGWLVCDLGPGDGTRLQFGQDLLQTFQVELVPRQVRQVFQENRKILISQDRIQQFLGLKPAQPEGHPFAPLAPRQEEGPAGTFSEPGSKKP